MPADYRAAERIDVYLAERVEGTTRSKLKEAIKAGRVSVNGAPQPKPSAPVEAGDWIALRLERPPPVEALPEAIPLDVVFEDEHLIVVDKPAGLVVHPAVGHRTGTLVNALLHHVGGGALSFEDGEDDGGDDEALGLSTATAAPRFDGDVTVRPGIVHRLDKDTSGLLVVAKTDPAHAALARQFERRTIRRRYLALAWGTPSPPAGTVETSIGRDPKERRRMAVVSEGRGRHAITHYEVVEPFAHAALVRFRLETGRTHQIRVHARHLGHPLLGDATYDGARVRSGPDTAKRRQFFKNLFERMPRQALHAHTLGFDHPATGAPMDFEAPLPDDFSLVLDRLRTVEPG